MNRKREKELQERVRVLEADHEEDEESLPGVRATDAPRGPVNAPAPARGVLKRNQYDLRLRGGLLKDCTAREAEELLQGLLLLLVVLVEFSGTAGDSPIVSAC